MSAIRKLLIGLALLVMAAASFSIGINEFQRRNQLIQEQKNVSGSSTVYLGDLEGAMMPAKLGTGIAVVFGLSGIVFLIASAGTYTRSNRTTNNEQNKPEMASPNQPPE